MPEPRSAAEYARWFASQGGKARSRSLTPQERSDIAEKAARARWRLTPKTKRRALALKAIRTRWAKAKKKSIAP